MIFVLELIDFFFIDDVFQLTDDQFRPSVLHIHEGNSVKWTWNSCQRPHVINEIKLCPKHYGIVKTTGG